MRQDDSSPWDSPHAKRFQERGMSSGLDSIAEDEEGCLANSSPNPAASLALETREPTTVTGKCTSELISLG